MNRAQKLLGLIEEGERDLAAAEQVTKEARETTAAALAAIAADVAEGLVTEQKAAARRASAERDLDEARERADTLRRSIPELRARLAQEDEQRRQREIEKARDAHRLAQQATLLAAKALARPLREAAQAAGELQRHRVLTADAEAALSAQLTAEDEPVARADEPWFAGRDLLDLLVAGPKRPLADAAEAAAAQEAARERQNTESLAWFSRNPSARALEQLPRHLHQRARTILNQHQAEWEEGQERMRATAKAREPVRI